MHSVQYSHACLSVKVGNFLHISELAIFKVLFRCLIDIMQCFSIIFCKSPCKEQVFCVPLTTGKSLIIWKFAGLVDGLVHLLR